MISPNPSLLSLSSNSSNKNKLISSTHFNFMASQHEICTPTVAITKRVSVYPKTLHPHRILNLSNLDRQCPTLMYLVFFYKPSHAHRNSLNSVFSSLKSGLEETLSIWYPAAGRLSLNPNDGKLNLWCNNEGAILVEAETQVKISGLGDLSQYNEFFEKLVYKPVFNENFSDMPLVVAQVTRFGCGGYSVGIGTSHSLFDGPATFDFIRAWASNSSIMKENGNRDDQLQNPVHERGPLLLLGNSQNTNMRAAAIDHLYQLIQQAASVSDYQINFAKDQNPQLVLKTYHLSGAMIENLKMKILGQNNNNSGSFSCSSFDVVTAHLWKARTKALGVKKERMVSLQFSVDTRNKMVPAMPKGFSGNAYVLASVVIKAGELEEKRHEEIIEKIKEAKNSVNGDYVSAYMKSLDGPKGTAQLHHLMELTMVSDWTRMPFHNLHFLNGNAAAYASPLLPPIPHVAYLMQNPIDFRAIDLRIGLPPQSLHAFSRSFLFN